MGRFIIKHINSMKPQKVNSFTNEVKNNIVNEQVMTTSEKIEMAQSVLNGVENAPVKRVKRDKGLIERTESSKTILTEDNKELLND